LARPKKAPIPASVKAGHVSPAMFYASNKSPDTTFAIISSMSDDRNRPAITRSTGHLSSEDQDASGVDITSLPGQHLRDCRKPPLILACHPERARKIAYPLRLVGYPQLLAGPFRGESHQPWILRYGFLLLRIFVVEEGAFI